MPGILTTSRMDGAKDGALDCADLGWKDSRGCGQIRGQKMAALGQGKGLLSLPRPSRAALARFCSTRCVSSYPPQGTREFLCFKVEFLAELSGQKALAELGIRM